MSGPLYINGTASPIQGPTQFVRRRVGGNEEVRSWTGAIAYVRAMANSLWDNGALEVTMRTNHGSSIGTVEARYATLQDDPNFPVQETISLDYNEQPIPINQHTYFSSLTKEQIAALDELIENREDLGVTAPLNGDTKESHYYWHRRMGIDSFKAQLPFITFTQTVGETYTGVLNTSNVGRIFTTAELNAEIPTDSFFTIAEPPIFAGDTFGFLRPGWLYRARKEVISDGNTQLFMTWEWGQFSTFLYEDAE